MLASTQNIELIEHSYNTLNVSYQEDIKAQFFAMNPGAIPCFSHQLLHDIDSFQKRLTNQISRNTHPHGDVDYLIFTSDVPGVFNLGGDLGFFVECIKNNDRETLSRYARLSIDVLHTNHSNLGFDDLTTISLVNGTSLGAGFEAALSSDYIIAEEGSEFKFPEVVFNMFPGMGAYSFLARRIAPAAVEKMIINAEGYTAEQLYDMGIVDMIADKGRLDEALHQFIRRHKKTRITRKAVLKMRNRILPLDKQELYDIADYWVDSALSLSDRDINAMSRLVRAQSRMMASQEPTVSESLSA
ncbi:MAG: crotonase/enoyl-CoA hydratase family protein [Candidatus Thiodiazotropha sp.]